MTHFGIASLDLTLPKIEIQAQKQITNPDSAKSLHVRISENGAETVALTLPAESALDLDGVMPITIAKRLVEENNFDFDALKHRLRENGLQPQELFDLNHNGKHIRVWLK